LWLLPLPVCEEGPAAALPPELPPPFPKAKAAAAAAATAALFAAASNCRCPNLPERIATSRDPPAQYSSRNQASRGTEASAMAASAARTEGEGPGGSGGDGGGVAAAETTPLARACASAARCCSAPAGEPDACCHASAVLSSPLRTSSVVEEGKMAKWGSIVREREEALSICCCCCCCCCCRCCCCS